MNAYDLFPQELPYNPELALSWLDSRGIKPTERFVRGKSLELVGNENLARYTRVIPTDEHPDNQWWDTSLPETARPALIDWKSRSVHATSYTVSLREKDKQINCGGLFIWPLYIWRGDVFIREAVLARLRKSDIWPPPKLSDSKIEVPGKGPSTFWTLDDLNNREFLALNQMNDLNVL